MADKTIVTTGIGSFTWTKEELTKIKEQCPDDWATILAGEFNLKVGTIRNVMQGSKPGTKIILRAIALMEEYQEEIKQAKLKVAAL